VILYQAILMSTELSKPRKTKAPELAGTRFKRVARGHLKGMETDEGCRPGPTPLGLRPFTMPLSTLAWILQQLENITALSLCSVTVNQQSLLDKSTLRNVGHLVDLPPAALLHRALQATDGRGLLILRGMHDIRDSLT
jgi:hypothetical protein